ncbi:MAG: flagellar hook-basal body complex protein FliE [Thermodesulfobacteriota bacterium]|nr:flagellar hook-basal body complex protein FliE [Thermodesulfobacteriota bacterium]
MFIDNHIVTNQPPSVKGVTTNSLPQGEPFIDVIQQSINKVNQLQVEAESAIQDLTLKKGDIHNAMIAIEKADISFQLMVKVRNKILAAYEEVMRMQV